MMVKRYYGFGELIYSKSCSSYQKPFFKGVLNVQSFTCSAAGASLDAAVK